MGEIWNNTKAALNAPLGPETSLKKWLAVFGLFVVVFFIVKDGHNIIKEGWN